MPFIEVAHHSDEHVAPEKRKTFYYWRRYTLLPGFRFSGVYRFTLSIFHFSLHPGER
jgi:hypothetical protein